MAWRGVGWGWEGAGVKKWSFFTVPNEQNAMEKRSILLFICFVVQSALRLEIYYGEEFVTFKGSFGVFGPF